MKTTKPKEVVTDPAFEVIEADAVSERRSSGRHGVRWEVDCLGEDTFLFASIANISAMGIFVRSTEPLPVGTRLVLAFEPHGHEPFVLDGQVAWVNALREGGDNPNPGMGIAFLSLSAERREQLVEVIRTIAYLRD